VHDGVGGNPLAAFLPLLLQQSPGAPTDLMSLPRVRMRLCGTNGGMVHDGEGGSPLAAFLRLHLQQSLGAQTESTFLPRVRTRPYGTTGELDRKWSII
jgi:hypothetical protein